MTFIALKNDTERIIIVNDYYYIEMEFKEKHLLPGKNKNRYKLINWMIFYYLFAIIERLYSKYEILKGFRLDKFTN